MATTTRRIVPGDESDIHDEPHLEGRRLTVQFVHAQVVDRGLEPANVADVYRALTYYYDHFEEMREIERAREHAIEHHEDLTTNPDTVRG